jgi:hypothetical protein
MSYDEQPDGDPHGECAEEIHRLEAALKWAEAERDALREVLLRHGFVPCDNPACNCGAWHQRYGLPERWQELKDELSEAGHPLCNENGNLLRNALRNLIGERDALIKENEALHDVHDLLLQCRADAKRIDWLGANPRESSIRVGGDFKACIFYGVACDPKWSVREAIDAATASPPAPTAASKDKQ